MDACTGAVKRKFADADRHAPGALVTDAEDGFIVGHDHELNAGERRRVAQDIFDTAALLGCDPDAARSPEDPAEVP